MKSTKSYYSYVLLVTAIISSVVFWPSKYVGMDIIKTFIISFGVFASLLFFALQIFKKKSLTMPSKAITYSALLLMISTVLSAFINPSMNRAFFGQGFEVNTISFILALFVCAFLFFQFVREDTEKTIVFYTGLISVFIVVSLMTILRIIFGSGFLTLSVLLNKTSTIFGGWNSLGFFSILVSLIVILAIRFLSPSKTIKTWYWIVVALSVVMSLFVNDARVWALSAIVYFIMTIYMTFSRDLSQHNGTKWFKKLSWIPFVAFVFFAFMYMKGGDMIRPVDSKIGLDHFELTLPWQMTLDVASDSLKYQPIFGAGANHFGKAFMEHKPTALNTSDFWQAEFGYGFGWLPTFLVTGGLVTSVLWLILLVFLGVSIVRTFKNLPKENSSRFLILSSGFGSIYLWLVSLIYVPSHALLLITFALTGIFIALSHSEKNIDTNLVLDKSTKTKSALFMIAVILFALVSVVFGIQSLKKIIAISYLNSGISIMTEKSDPDMADSKFAKALLFDSSDIYWQARAEAGMSKISKLVNTVPAVRTASSTETLANQITDTIIKSLSYSRKAVSADPYNYYNHISEARVLEVATSLKMKDAYENALVAYNNAIAANPTNPAIYLSLAQFLSSQNKLDEALQAAGKALSLKNNYLDAVFLVSQIQSAKGNISEAITAGQVAVQINPNNPIAYFQLGLLYYYAKNYEFASQAMSAALKLQPDYANAKYFLGLSYARLNKTELAIQQFVELDKANPNNPEISAILSVLRAGRSPFVDSKASVSANVEKRSSLPIKEKKTKTDLESKI